MCQLCNQFYKGFLKVLIKESFNRITVDGDTSTNDACVLVQQAPAVTGIGAYRVRYMKIIGAVTQVCVELAQAIIKDGEGATKFIRIELMT